MCLTHTQPLLKSARAITVLQLNKLITVVLFPVHKGTKSFCSEVPRECHCTKAFLTPVPLAIESQHRTGGRQQGRQLGLPGCSVLLEAQGLLSKGPSQASAMMLAFHEVVMSYRVHTPCLPHLSQSKME